MSLSASVASASSDSTTPLPMKQRTCLAQDPGRDQRQYGLAAINDQGVARIVTALESRHRARAIGQQIHYLSLAFITPLGADDNDKLSHDAYSVDKKEQHDSDEHAAQSGDAHFAIAERQNPGQRAFGAPGRKKRQYAFQHENQRQRGAKIREYACHGS